MKAYYKITPEGTKDYLFEEASAINEVANITTSVYRSKGYHEVKTPGLEFFDEFNLKSSAIAQERMFKLTDNKGRLMVIRPDSTLPIARVVATRLQNKPMPIRLFYNQSVFRSNPSLTGRKNEVRQTGIELLGAVGKRADLEVIITAIEALQKIVPDFRIELGHAGLFRSLAKKLDCSDEIKESIRDSIQSKNYSQLNSILDTLPQSDTVEAIRKLPRLFGGEEVLTQAAPLFEGTEGESDLAYLSEIYHALSKLMMGDKLIMDLGFVQRNDYYSDFIFSAYVEGSGDAVLTGGRYDKLLDEFDAPMPAAGFALNADALADIMLSSGKSFEEKPADIIVHADEGFEMDAISQCRFYTLSGFKCENSVFTSRDEVIRYAKENGVKQVCFMSGKPETIDIENMGEQI